MGGNRRRALLVATAGALAVTAAVAAPALSAGTSHPTRILWLGGNSNVPEDSITGGQLETSKACMRLRKVIMSKETSSGWTRVDRILSSAHGAWAFRYVNDQPDPMQVRFRVTRATRDGDVCQGDEKRVTLSANSRAGMRTSSAPEPRGAASYPTAIQWRASALGEPSTYWIEMGQLETNETCQGLRKVIMYVKRGNEYRREDTVASSPHGTWAFHLERTGDSPTENVRWTVTQDVRRHGDVVCRGETVEETV